MALSIEKNVGGIEGLCVIEPILYTDKQGYYMESYNMKELATEGLDLEFVQDNIVFSTYGVLRGMHINKKHPQGKLIRSLHGSIWDVVVDLRRNSKTYKKKFSIELSSENRKQLYIPEGFAHGYLVISPTAEVLYKVTTHYIPKDEIGIAWNSEELNIKWPIKKSMNILMSESDANNKEFCESILI